MQSSSGAGGKTPRSGGLAFQTPKLPKSGSKPPGSKTAGNCDLSSVCCCARARSGSQMSLSPELTPNGWAGQSSAKAAHTGGSRCNTRAEDWVLSVTENRQREVGTALMSPRSATILLSQFKVCRPTMRNSRRQENKLLEVEDEPLDLSLSFNAQDNSQYSMLLHMLDTYLPQEIILPHTMEGSSLYTQLQSSDYGFITPVCDAWIMMHSAHEHLTCCTSRSSVIISTTIEGWSKSTRSLRSKHAASSRAAR